MASHFQHYCGCGSSWELEDPTPVEVEHLLDLIGRTHHHTPAEFTAAQAYTPTMHLQDETE